MILLNPILLQRGGSHFRRDRESEPLSARQLILVFFYQLIERCPLHVRSFHRLCCSYTLCFPFSIYRYERLSYFSFGSAEACTILKSSVNTFSLTLSNTL